jgi:hypothetical protein
VGAASHPEDRLAADERKLALENREFREDGKDVEVREASHSSGFASRRLTRTLGKAKSPFSRRSWAPLFSPEASARASSSRERYFSRALGGVETLGFVAHGDKIRLLRRQCNRAKQNAMKA